MLTSKFEHCQRGRRIQAAHATGHIGGTHPSARGQSYVGYWSKSFPSSQVLSLMWIREATARRLDHRNVQDRECRAKNGNGQSHCCMPLNVDEEADHHAQRDPNPLNDQ